MDFTGKVVIVTGASSGVGATTAKLFASLNATLTLVGRNRQRLQDVADFCHSVKGIQPLPVKLDLTHDGSCEEVVRRTVETFGRLDVLVNCAGNMAMSSLFDDTTDAFDDIFKINLRVPYKLTHSALPHLVKTKGNVVILRAAMFDMVKVGFINFSIMNSALERFTKEAAAEAVISGVRINAVSIGLAKTNLLENLNFDELERQLVFNTIERKHRVKILQPEEVARMIIFVASGVCPSINGANIYVDGASRFK